ncbi:MAG: hypothetical protein RLN84_01000 [Rhodospirillaceae bacterium]
MSGNSSLNYTAKHWDVRPNEHVTLPVQSEDCKLWIWNRGPEKVSVMENAQSHIKDILHDDTYTFDVPAGKVITIHHASNIKDASGSYIFLSGPSEVTKKVAELLDFFKSIKFHS